MAVRPAVVLTLSYFAPGDTNVFCWAYTSALVHKLNALAKQRNAALTAEQMGHKDARMLYAHYPLRSAKVVKYCRRI